MATIRVRVNPADSDEYVIYADVDDDCGQWWLGQRSGGRWTGWEYDEHVAGWPEFELTIPLAGPPAGRRTGRHAGLPGPSPVREITQIHEGTNQIQRMVMAEPATGTEVMCVRGVMMNQ